MYVYDDLDEEESLYCSDENGDDLRNYSTTC